MTKTQVALVRCAQYDPAAVDAAVGRGLALLGGAERFVRPGERILLKPNLLVGGRPQNAITTHPALFAAVAHHLQAAGAVLCYGDSPGVGTPASAARRAGLAAVAGELDISLADFANGEAVSFPEGDLIRQFTIARGVLAADGLISLPKLKTHGLMRLTGAVKNQFGCVPGLLKGEFHARLPDRDHFAQMLVDLNRLLRPRLYVMDGIVAMEGNGPRNGDPRPLSVLLLSADPIALDATVCRIVDLDPAMVPTITWGEVGGLGQASPVEILGDPLASFFTPDFAVDRRREAAAGKRRFLRRLVNRWVVPRPVVVPENCTRCGTCVRVCPVTPKAIDFRGEEGRDAPPQHDYQLCIRCYCCQELCPANAITIEIPPLGRLIHRL
ncbi:MAG: DUF362 domain-containing protein [Anaerolineae bacterium]|nr:DUF362 domain-containing protein [Anaerolineae bacterium]